MLPLFFLSGNTNSIFALDYISGALTLNGPLDRENPFYSAGFILTVKVRSGRQPHGRVGGLPAGDTSLWAMVGIHGCELMFPSRVKQDA